MHTKINQKGNLKNLEGNKIRNLKYLNLWSTTKKIQFEELRLQ